MNESKSLSMIWSRLASVSQLTFHAKTKSHTEGGWSRQGKGEVRVVREENAVLVFYERGIWKDGIGQQIGFSNIFRWNLDVQANVVSLEHLRMGAANPVFLFYLAPDGPKSLRSVDAHLCKNDAYLGKVYLEPQGVTLQWQVVGPKKNEEIKTCYY